MKLRNKKTGEIVDGGFVLTYYDGIAGNPQHSLSELNKEWEDYEEPKEYWFIDTYSYEVSYLEERRNEDLDNFNKEIGNYFETKEEAEKAVEKLKAFANLRKRGFKFKDVELYAGGRIKIEATVEANTDSIMSEREYVVDNLGLLFGGEE